MSKVHLIIEDEQGQKTTHCFELNGDLENLDGIDQAVEAFSHQALPQLESTLLSAAQERAIEEAKKKTI